MPGYRHHSCGELNGRLKAEPRLHARYSTEICLCACQSCNGLCGIAEQLFHALPESHGQLLDITTLGLELREQLCARYC